MYKEKILVVDDEKSIGDAFIASFDDYRIMVARDGREALNILKRPNDIDLIVTDMMMPGLTGVELIREIKKINPKHKVVLLTGYSSKDVAIEALRSDADEYIEKPFDVHRVREVFERLLNEKKDLTKVERAQRFIRRNYDKSVTLTDVSKELFLSPKYFSRMFKEKTGKGFARYKLELKMNKAKEMLKKTNFTIAQVAYKTGYRNPASFMKIFRKMTSFTPSQYRWSGKTKDKLTTLKRRYG